MPGQSFDIFRNKNRTGGFTTNLRIPGSLFPEMPLRANGEIARPGYVEDTFLDAAEISCLLFSVAAPAAGIVIG